MLTAAALRIVLAGLVQRRGAIPAATQKERDGQARGAEHASARIAEPRACKSGSAEADGRPAMTPAPDGDPLESLLAANASRPPFERSDAAPTRGGARLSPRMDASIAAAAERLRGVIAGAGKGLVGREVVVQLVVLAAVAREHVLLVGPPGTAKSEAVRRVAKGLGGRYFEYLLGRFTEPSEIFGPVDLQRLREGVVQTRTEGMLPEADIAFLDEVFLGSTAILNTLLGLLNERTFRRGHTDLAVPLRVCVGASNALPEDPQLAAFADRFLLHAFLEPTEDPQLESLLEAGWALQSLPVAPGESLAALDTLIAAVPRVDVTAVRPHLAEAIRTLRGAGITMSDRRVVKLQRLVAAAALLDGREEADGSDLWPMLFALVRPTDHDRARDLLRTTLEHSRNATLAAAAEHASLGPLARATRMVHDADALLAEHPEPGTERRRWRLKLEGIARELDASFATDARPPELAQARERIVAALAEVPLDPPHP